MGVRALCLNTQSKQPPTNLLRAGSRVQSGALAKPKEDDRTRALGRAWNLLYKESYRVKLQRHHRASPGQLQPKGLTKWMFYRWGLQ